MSNRVKILYAVDVIVVVAFILSGISGIVLWRFGPGGYQGGRNANFGQLALGLSHSTWNDLHVWTSLVMGVGIFVHLLLHWSWIVRGTKRLFAPPVRSRRVSPEPEACEVEV